MKGLVIATFPFVTFAYNVVPPSSSTSSKSVSCRRNLLRKIVSSVTTATAITSQLLPLASNAGEVAMTDGKNEQLIEDVYFGMGCFWHIQHEFVEAERHILKRGDKQLSSRAGYAGGKAADKDGLVCYHNFQNIGDYGKLGHGEVVGMAIPSSKIVEFAKVYFSLFDPKTGERVDPQDRGGEYRYLIGLPGGMNHPQFGMIADVARSYSKELALGKGNEGDTLGKNIVYLYDTNKFPFYQAEIYHQYHDDFQSPPYGKKYNELVNDAFDDGRLKITGCPDRV